MHQQLENDAQEKQHEAKRRKKELMKDEVSFAVIALASRVLVGNLHIVDKKTRTNGSVPKDMIIFVVGQTLAEIMQCFCEPTH